MRAARAQPRAAWRARALLTPRAATHAAVVRRRALLKFIRNRHISRAAVGDMMEWVERRKKAHAVQMAAEETLRGRLVVAREEVSKAHEKARAAEVKAIKVRMAAKEVAEHGRFAGLRAALSGAVTRGVSAIATRVVGKHLALRWTGFLTPGPCGRGAIAGSLTLAARSRARAPHPALVPQAPARAPH